MNLLSEIQRFIKQGQPLSAISTAASAARSIRAPSRLSELERALKPISSEVWDHWLQRSTRIQFLSGDTFQHLSKPLGFALKLERIKAEVRFSEYHVATDGMHPSAIIKDFAPHFVVLHPTHADIAQWPGLSLSREHYDQDLKSEFERWKNISISIHEKLSASVIFDLFAPYPFSSLGEGEWKSYGGKSRFTEELNALLRGEAIVGVQVHSVDRIVREIGENHFWDHRMHAQAKVSMSPEGSEAYIKSIARKIGANLGLSKKCLVLDLDNTLWGGVIGDVGVEGIQIGSTSAEGESFSNFQLYASSLKKHGVLLAVCSKNEEANALGPFQELTHMPLKHVDFDVFVANWDAKSKNLEKIAHALNIGIDSLVFFDDNPAERMEVLTHAPQVFTVDVPEDPVDYVTALDRCGLFSQVQPTEEDLSRSIQYEQQRARTKLEESTSDYGAFLQSLSMVAQSGPFHSNDLIRISQLVNKTNQFNVTTRRYTVAECEAWMKNPNAFTLTVRLQDRFGDHGLIAVLMAELKGRNLVIDSWLMSCRILKRSVEEFVMTQLIVWAEAHKVDTITGEFIATKKNGLVAELFPRMGFHKTGETAEAIQWALNAPFLRPEHSIQEIKEN